MKRLIQILVAIAFGIIMLEIMIVAESKNWFEFTTMRIMSLTSIMGLIYYYVFEAKKSKSK